jgi:hypothetical protein
MREQSLHCVNMKNFAVMLLLLCGALNASAQVTVELFFDQEQYLPHESLVARVRIANSSGLTLTLGDQPGWLHFQVEPDEGGYAKETNPPNIMETFVLESSKTATVRVDLSKSYDLTKVGRYKVLATVRIPALGSNFASNSKTFVISRGNKIWAHTFGVRSDAAEGADARPEIRQYQLVQANLRDELRLYVRVTDDRENDLRVVPIGPLVSFSRPEPQLDRWSNLHLLYQDGARNFTYTALTPEGQVISRETHLNTDTRPVLVVNDEGRISVKGGVRKVTQNDLPPPDDKELAPEPIALPAPTASTNTPAKTNKSNRNTVPEFNDKTKKKSTNAKETKR